MKIVIDTKVCEKLGMTLSEVLAVLLIKENTDIEALIENMLMREILIEDTSNELMVTENWDNICSNILLTSDKTIPKEDRIESLASSLMEIFPKGKKGGTNTYWRGNLKDTKLRLKKFFKLYGSKYTNEQIVNATKQYVESFNGNYSYMRVLKYFIWKDERKIDSEGQVYIEEISDLATFIHNAGQEDINNDWINTLV